MNKINKATKLFVSVMMVVSTLGVPIYSSRVVHAEDEIIAQDESINTKKVTFHIVDKNGNYVVGVNYHFQGTSQIDGVTDKDGPFELELPIGSYSLSFTPPEGSDLTLTVGHIDLEGDLARDSYVFTLYDDWTSGRARFHLSRNQVVGFDESTQEFQYESVPLPNEPYQIISNETSEVVDEGVSDEKGNIVSKVLNCSDQSIYSIKAGGYIAETGLGHGDDYSDVRFNLYGFYSYTYNLVDNETKKEIQTDDLYGVYLNKNIMNGDKIAVKKGTLISTFKYSDFSEAYWTILRNVQYQYMEDGYFIIKQIASGNGKNDDAIILMDDSSDSVTRTVYQNKIQVNATNGENQIIQGTSYILTQLDEDGNKINVYYEGKDQDVLNGFEPGTYLLEASADGYKSVSKEAEIKDSSDVQVIDVMLEKNEVVKPDQPSTDDKDNTGTTTKPDIPSTDDKTDTPSTPTTNVEVKTEGNVPTVSLDTNKEELVKILVESGALTKEE